MSIKNKEISNLLSYISNQEQNIFLPPSSDFFVSMKVKTQLYTEKSPNSLPVASYSSPNDPQATKLYITEEVRLKKYPYDYKLLVEQLRNTYVDFKENKKLWDILKHIKSVPKLTYNRPNNIMSPDGAKTTFYSTEVFKVFNNHYIKK